VYDRYRLIYWSGYRKKEIESMGKTKTRRILAWLLSMIMVLSVTLSGIHYGSYAADDAAVAESGKNAGDGTGFEASATDAEAASASETDAPEEIRLADMISIIPEEEQIVGASTSTNLNDFINNVTISAPTNDAGQYMVLADTPYDIRFFFAENANVQFPDDATGMTYSIPENITADPQNGVFTIRVTVGNDSYIVAGNRYHLENNILTVNFNQNDPNFRELTRSSRANFNFTIQGSFNASHGDEDTVDFTDEIAKDIVIDSSSSLDVSKASSIDYNSGKINYTVTVKSSGNSRNVVVKDTISGDNGVLSLVPDSISVTSSTGQPVSITGGPSGNSFSYSIPSMKNNEIITIRYSADIDAGKITSQGGKYVQSSENNVKATSDGDPDGDETKVTTSLDYTPSISKSNASVAADGKTLTWKITANPERKVSMSGSKITDRIPADSQSIMTYAGDGIKVRVLDENDAEVRVDNVSWDSLTSKSDSAWTYEVPAGDAGHSYKYEITYDTEVDTSAITTMKTVNNTVETDGGKTAGSSAQVAPEGGQVELNKAPAGIDRENKEVTWNVTFTVPGTGLNQAVLTDIYPSQWLDSGNVCEAVKAGTIQVSGLTAGETYSADYQSDRLVMTFSRDGEPGLKGTGNTRTIVVTYKTEISDEWVQKSAEQSYLVDHQNAVELQTPDLLRAQGTVKISPSKADKRAKEESTRTVGGVELPVYKYELILQNVDSVENTILDTFDTDLLEVYDQPYDAWQIYGGDQYYQGYQGEAKANYLNTVNGVEIHTSAASLPKDGDGYYTAYRLVYYLTVKNKAALEILQERAVEEENGTYEIANTAEWNGIPSSAKHDFKYDALDKEILTSDEELKKTDEEIWADFRISVNPAGAVMNDGNPMEVVDTISNLSIDISSIEVNPSAGASWDMSGDVLTLTVPDATALEITYRARVKRADNTQGGSTSRIPISNTAALKRHGVSEFEKRVDKTAEYTNSGSGSADVPAIGLLKYEAGNMQKKLEGAEFMLLNKDKDPILDKNHNEVTFTTNAQGLITVQGDMAEEGWALEPDEKYYLREIKAPDGYMLSNVDYEFTISENGTTDYSKFLYHSGDIMSAKDVLGADVMIDKTWSDGNDQHDSDVVVVRLQQKIGDDGDFQNTIRYYDAESDTWKEEERTLTLNKAGNWKGSFRGLPATVPPALPEEAGVDYVYADYRIVEVSVNGTPVSDGSYTVNEEKPAALPGGTYNFELLNQVEEKTGSILVTKQFVFPAGVTVQNSDKLNLNFEVKREDDVVATFTYTDIYRALSTGMEGYRINNLPIGEYQIVETNANTVFAGYHLGIDAANSTTEVDALSVTDGGEARADFVNTYESTVGDLEVKKTVVSSTAADHTKDFTFTVTLSDRTVNGIVGDVTFLNGVATFTLKDGETAEITGLPKDVGYTVAETTADGFVTTKTGVTGAIGEEKSTAAFTNTRIPVYGGLVIQKQGYVHETCAEDPDKTRPLSGVTFELKSIELPDGESPILQVLETNENGLVIFENLIPGRYAVTEKETQPNYILDGSTWYAVIEEDGSCKGLTDAEGNPIKENILINDQYRTDISFKKVNENHSDQTLGGSTYDLFRVTTEGTEDYITSRITGEDGRVTFEGVLTGNTYRIREAVSPSGYYVSEKPLTIGFRVVEDGTGGKNVEIDPALLDDGDSTVVVDEDGNITWLEPPVVVEVSKVDADGRFVAGAKLRIEDENGNVVVPEWTSGSEAKVIEGELVIGQTYYLVETEAPEDYEKAAPVKFTISDEAVSAGQNLVVKVKMIDQRIEKTSKPEEPEKPDVPKQTTDIKKETSVKTGDSSPLGLYGIFSMFSLLGMAVVTFLKKQNKKED